MNQIITTLLNAFLQRVDVVQRGFLSTFFRTTPEDIVDTDEVSIDIKRGSTVVAPVITNLKDGATIINSQNFSTKKYTPPVFSMVGIANIWDLMKRQPGESPIANAQTGDWYGRMSRVLREEFLNLFGMLKEAIEYQASQIFQTGKLILQDEKGNDAYSIDFPVKATHFPDAAIPWGDSGADPVNDLKNLAATITKDAKKSAAIAIFGSNAWAKLIENESFKELVKKDALNLGALNPEMVDKGGVYMGYAWLGAYKIDLWTYESYYQKLNDETDYSYVDPDKVIMTCNLSARDFKCVFGGVPSLEMDEPFNEIMPSEVVYDNVARINTRVYKDTRGNNYSAEATCRPLCFPVNIDSFGCLTTT